MAAAESVQQWELPQLKAIITVPPHHPLYDVKFYPYTLPGVDPFFAVVGGQDTIVCRPSPEKEKGVEIVRWFRDENENELLCCCCWTKEQGSGDPLICQAGTSGLIKILNVKSGQLTLVGHGDEIMDLAISPISPLILASASADHTVRLWSLDDAHDASVDGRQPCAAICAGEGHRESVLSIAFHPLGRYMLSGGMDHAINLWVLPMLPDSNTGSDTPTCLHYPHFSTTEVHSDYVDCVAFHHDLILSKAAREGKIVLWHIKNFSSQAPPPSPDRNPTTHDLKDTRSAFGDGFERLLQFKIPGENDPFFMRFDLFSAPGKHPVLAMGDMYGKVSMWDLTRLVESAGIPPALLNKMAKKTNPKFKNPVVKAQQHRDGSAASSTVSSNAVNDDSQQSSTNPISTSTGKIYDLSDPFARLEAHATVGLTKHNSTVRKAAWSVGGEWLVVCGEQGMLSVLRRWVDGIPFS
ncbi:MAG: hypothetical protein M1840_002856 [Geoglossum simile]|nr:MAG: hypothetical protein M1840_002856 [Geoglossum simile]